MKIKTLWLAMALVLGLSVLTASAIEISEELRLQIQQDVEAVQDSGPRMGDMMAALREIGASYLPELVAPFDVDNIQGLQRRRWMTGVYMMDMTYASTFGQREPAARFGQATYRLLEELGYPHPDMERRYREALEQIDLPDGDAKLTQLIQEQNQDPLWQEMLDTGEGVTIVVDSLYGFLIEGLYLTSELCVLADYEPRYLMYVAYMRESLQAYNQLLHHLGDSPELAASMEVNDRLNFLASILVILGDLPEVGPAQLDSLRPAITDARREIVN